VVLGVGLRSALILGAVCLLLAPVLNSVLHLHSLPTALLVGVSAIPLTYMGAQLGVLQGERRWGLLALVYLAQGLGRLFLGLGLILVWPTEFAAMAGVALGCWLPVAIGALALSRPRTDVAHSEGHPGLDLIREVAHSSQALLAFFALSNADILVARATMSDSQAGLYAAGLIMVKAVLFLPQFVVVYAFPSMSKEETNRRTLLLAMGLSSALGTVDQGRPVEVRHRRHPAVDDPAARLLGAGPTPGSRRDHDLDRARAAGDRRPRGGHRDLAGAGRRGDRRAALPRAVRRRAHGQPLLGVPARGGRPHPLRPGSGAGG
jgi:hypothetical protein